RQVSFPLPAGPMMLNMDQSGGAAPWATVQVSAAVPLRQPAFFGYRMAKKIEPVSQRVPGQWTRGDVARVVITVEATAERNWVVVNDPIPAGATIIGNFANQSQMLGSQENGGGGTNFQATDADGKLWDVQVGVQPSWIERRNDSWRGYFGWVPRGSFTIAYVMRLNAPGVYNLPSSRVEAMYSPSINAQLPNAAFTIRDK
ncbi:MAG: alpha-2-macroglobulin, partial [Proteobacteria bacterium]|nr:alpha-2-macroglobulin [Pseudomonadota bacterium]